jgi:hypothetical protein
MKAQDLTFVLVALLGAPLSGCGLGPSALAPSPAQPGSEEAAVREELARQDELVEEHVYAADEQTALEPFDGRLALVDPLFFWRQILRVERSFEVAFADTDSTGRPTTAVVVARRRLGGWFNLLVREDGSEEAPREGRVIRKPLEDHWVRRILLERDPAGDRIRRRWRIAAISGVEITGRDATTEISRLRVQSAALDTTLTDPLAFWRLRAILRLDPGSEVVLTATTPRADDVVVLYTPEGRRRLRAQGDGAYRAIWPVRSRAGLGHFGVNALSHGTVYDDEAPYDSKTWLFPYQTAPESLADRDP